MFENINRIIGSDDIMITKKYKNYPNMMFVNEDTLSKLKMFQIDLKIFLKIKTLKEVKIVVCNDIANNEVYFYINRFTLACSALSI